MSLNAEEKGLGNILQDIGEKKILTKPVPKKKKIKKQTRFVFKDEFDSKGIGSKDNNKSESYNYDNKSRFKFKFNDGSEQSNFIGTSYGGAGMGGSMGSGGGGGGRR
jgi:hypothetical protein